MKKSGWVMVATLFAILAVLWITVGAWYAAKQMGVAQVPSLLGWGLFVVLMGLFSASVYAGCKAPE